VGCVSLAFLRIRNSLEDARIAGETGKLDVGETGSGETAGLARVPFVEELVKEGGVLVDLVVGEGSVDLPGNGSSGVIDEICRGFVNITPTTRKYGVRTLSDGGEVDQRSNSSGLDICGRPKATSEKESGGIDDTSTENYIAPSSNLTGS
jgi:hypothetical protein